MFHVQIEYNIKINLNGVLCAGSELNQSSTDWVPQWAQDHRSEHLIYVKGVEYMEQPSGCSGLQW